MAVSALHSAASGLSALSTQLDVVANNLANVNTTGFKRSRVNFEDLLYQIKQQPGVENSNGTDRPAGLYVGMGTRVSNTQLDFSQGEPIPTEQPLDVMIAGGGFFRVQITQDFNDGIGYTRAGNFAVNRDGEIVLGNADGPRLDPPITVPAGTDLNSINISSTGEVAIVDPGEEDPQVIGDIELTMFINPIGLQPIGGNVYVPTPASGPPDEGEPGEEGFGILIHRHLEGSNVEPVTELVDLIKTQRAFELNSQTIQAADETLQVVSNLRRF
jgi:flagellar basal-body rod protein FlgG